MRKRFVLLLLLFISFLHAAERRIALLVKKDFNGEVSFAHRIQTACKNLAWEADILPIEKPDALAERKYDFVLNLVPDVYPHPDCGNYLAIFHPAHNFFTRKSFLKKKYRSYDGYLLTYPLGRFNKRKTFLDQRRFPCMRWYPTAQKRDYQVNDPSSLFYICCWWSDRFDDAKFKQLLGWLDQEPYMRFYGHRMFQAYYPQSYRGPIPYDGESLYKTAAEAGIVLVLHSSDHNKHGLPSGRIFEAAAASAVILCDQNAFVKEHFGDAVLYIDTDEDAASILGQIRVHMNWIQTHKSEALAKAKRAYEIYREKFLLEDQLLRLEKFHEKMSARKKPSVYSQLRSFVSRLFLPSSGERNRIDAGGGGRESLPALHAHQ